MAVGGSSDRLDNFRRVAPSATWGCCWVADTFDVTSEEEDTADDVPRNEQLSSYRLQ